MVSIILLNGVSSSGKSSIAKALQKRLDAPYLHVCIDVFEEMMPDRTRLTEQARQTVFNKMLSGFHHSIAALASCDNNLIVDTVIIEDDDPRNWAIECLTLLAPYDVYLVGVRCNLDELERRELARGDRPAGLSRWQFSRMHSQLIYDFEVDTSVYTAEQCAHQIIAARPQSASPALAATLARLNGARELIFQPAAT
jgi:chloramphenicol 3-O phosphotransferase